MHFPWQAASAAHLMYRMTDAEFCASARLWMATNPNRYAIESFIIGTRNRRRDMTLEDDTAILSDLAKIERPEKTS